MNIHIISRDIKEKNNSSGEEKTKKKFVFIFQIFYYHKIQKLKKKMKEI